METKNEFDDLLKRAMQFESGELPEPDPSIQKRLQKKVKKNAINKNKSFFSSIVQFLNIDIKLYHAGIAIAATLLIFLVLRNNNEAPATFKQKVIVADTNVGSSLKNDSFLVKNFSVSIY